MRGSVLQRPTLVLNRHWQPVHVAPVARALVMVWNHAACVIDPDDFQLYTWSDWAKLAPREGEPFIRTVRFQLRVPEVLAAETLNATRPGTRPSRSAAVICSNAIIRRASIAAASLAQKS